MAMDRTQKEKAEYNALLAQMNPHFLYNTLESINALAKLHSQKDISEAITKLSRLLRASLSGKNQEIPLSQELDYIRQYLELQKLVSGEYLEWDITVDPSLLSCSIPKLLLQPLVENSIIHGFENKTETAMILILAKVADEKLIVELYDNGKGAEQELINKILLGDDAKDSLRERSHIGINSIQRRIRYLYGEKYGLQISSNTGEGTIVKVILPFKKA